MEEGHPNPSEGSSCVSRGAETSRTLKHGWESFGQRQAGVCVRDPHWRQEPLRATAGSCMDDTRRQEEAVLMEMSRVAKQGGTRLWGLQRNFSEAWWFVPSGGSSCLTSLTLL